MKKNQAIQDYSIAEYRLIVPLSDDLQGRVADLRRQLHEKHQVKLPFELKPSLTVLNCHAYEKMEARLKERLQAVAVQANAFKVELENFAAYPSHTIYVHVPTRSPFNELVKQLKKLSPLLRIPDHGPHYINEPHLLIAQQLKPSQFKSMWLDCEHSEFSGRFVADHFLLMKRSVISRKFQVVKRFDLASLDLSVKQGILFG